MVKSLITKQWFVKFLIAVKYYQIEAKLNVIILPNIGAFLWFVKLGWLCLTNKVIIMTTDVVSSNGGYKYLSVTISKRPVSANHTYGDID